MDIDDKYMKFNDEVRMWGPKAVRKRYAIKREQALDRGDQDEADLWEARWQSVGIYVTRRRFKYNLFSSIAGAMLALFPTGYIWLEGQDIVFTTFTFLIITAILYAAIRNIDKLVHWVAGVLMSSAIGFLGWEAYIWLPEARWPGFRVGDALEWSGITPSFVSIENWVGISKIINAIYIWIFELSLPAACVIIGSIFLCIAIIFEIFDVPKWEEEEEI